MFVCLCLTAAADSSRRRQTKKAGVQVIHTSRTTSDQKKSNPLPAPACPAPPCCPPCCPPPKNAKGSFELPPCPCCGGACWPDTPPPGHPGIPAPPPEPPAGAAPGIPHPPPPAPRIAGAAPPIAAAIVPPVAKPATMPPPAPPSSRVNCAISLCVLASWSSRDPPPCPPPAAAAAGGPGPAPSPPMKADGAPELAPEEAGKPGDAEAAICGLLAAPEPPAIAASKKAANGSPPEAPLAGRGETRSAAAGCCGGCNIPPPDAPPNPDKPLPIPPDDFLPGTWFDIIVAPLLLPPTPPPPASSEGVVDPRHSTWHRRGTAAGTLAGPKHVPEPGRSKRVRRAT